ncbi:hypothetical protein [Desulfomonile tiedjei]|uniref:Uncharacterized protein n=1 Tax=Desulfomonile tiedjei (strain ATCC 49306 / DSM 6799 / DCB-1) TaxID=706587 RepID=I4CA86_DESTA|nr:hypothetical protein [Desulfomonile tiedjei]AFM26477.1 hypothetical protein Desti_3835 [Desulfomonile tiedjei DSM 6799]
MKKAVWLTFDLSVTGDYEGMYTWLANHEAIECGDNVGFIQYDSSGDLINELKNDIRENVDITKKTRVYVIYRDDDQKVKGSFLFGKRQQAPWTGYGSVPEGEAVDEL